MIPSNRDYVLSMDQGRVRHIQSESPEAHQHKLLLRRSHSINMKMRGNYEGEREAQMSDGGPDGSASFSRQNSSWIASPILAIRSLMLAIRTLAAKPNFLLVCIHGSLLALFWVVTLNTCSCEVLFDPELWFMVPWVALSCVEFLLSIFVGQASCRHLMNGRRRMSSPFLLPILV